MRQPCSKRCTPTPCGSPPWKPAWPPVPSPLNAPTHLTRSYRKGARIRRSSRERETASLTGLPFRARFVSRKNMHFFPAPRTGGMRSAPARGGNRPMGTGRLDFVLRQLRHLIGARSDTAHADGVLLDRFLQNRDEE